MMMGAVSEPSLRHMSRQVHKVSQQGFWYHLYDNCVSFPIQVISHLFLSFCVFLKAAFGTRQGIDDYMSSYAGV